VLIGTMISLDGIAVNVNSNRTSLVIADRHVACHRCHGYDSVHAESM